MCSFTITVQAPTSGCDLIPTLIAEVGDLATVCAKLQDFINHTRAQAGKKIPRPVAQDWIADARAILQALGCP